MVDFFDKLYSSIISKNAFLDRIRYYSVLRVIVRVTANAVLPIYFRLTGNNPDYALKQTDKTEGRIIVSLTTFPARIDKVWLVVETILQQTVKPDMIILWLSKEQFSSKEMLPKRLLKLQKRGLKIELCDGDLRSHKKYYYTLQKYPKDILITVDDDIFYRSTMIQNLLSYHKQNPDVVVCSYARKIKFTENNLPAPYLEWQYLDEQADFHISVFFGTGGGTLFPAQSLPLEALNSAFFMEYCLWADDVWLNAMVRLNNRFVSKVCTTNSLLPILIRNNERLASVNVYQSMNDKQIESVRIFCLEKYNTDPFSYYV